VINTRRTKRVIALAVGLSLVAAACGDDDDSADDEPAEAEEPSDEPADEEPADEEPADEEPADEEPADEEPADEEPADEEPADEEPADEEPADEEPSGEAAMVLTVDLAPEAVWEDGSPITVADLQCTNDAYLNTPGSLTTVGYDQIISVEQGESDKQAIISFATVYAPYKALFNPILQASRHADCMDVSLDFEDAPPSSARPFKFEEWSTSQSILVPNESFWGDAPAADRIVMVPFADQDTEKNAIASGEVDLISPQWDPGFNEVVEANDSVDLDLRPGADYEGLYFNQGGKIDPQYEGPFANDEYRQAFAMSIDTAALFEQIYRPIGGPDAELLNCGPIAPGPYCDNATGPFADMYDPEGAAAVLEGAGWTQDGSGFWVNPDTGEVPEVRWIVNTGNTRRENTQAYLIPLLADAGFNVVADNCDAACFFQQRLPALDYDLAMYISTAPPDPSYLTASFTCSQIPTEANNYVGQNSQGWCNEDASAALEAADQTVDEAERVELIQSALQAMADDTLMLPMFQFPKSHLWRSDKLGPPEVIAENTINYMSFARSLQSMEDLDGDGQVVIGAEQWPECLNPITECANSSWYVWTVSFAVMPGLWDTTDSQEYVPTNLLAGEPVVEVL
jgi:peptide/nickel transport system substrate-binding protein